MACEFVGVPGVVQEGLTYLRPGGRYLWVGNIMPGHKAEIVPHDVVRLSRTIVGVVTYDAWVLPRALDFLLRTGNRYPFERLISHRYPLEEINRAFEEADWMARRGGVTRAAIVM